jgi:hypothetical protein
LFTTSRIKVSADWRHCRRPSRMVCPACFQPSDVYRANGLAKIPSEPVKVLFEDGRVIFWKGLREKSLGERRGEVQDQDRSLLPHAASHCPAPHLDIRHTFGILPDITHNQERHHSGIHQPNHLEQDVRRSGFQHDEPSRKRRHCLLIACEHSEQQSRRERSAKPTWRTRGRRVS